MLVEMGAPADEKSLAANVVALYKEVATRLGNTPAVCRQYYVHPCVLDSYEAGEFRNWIEEVAGDEEEPWLERDEQLTLHVLRRAMLS